MPHATQRSEPLRQLPLACFLPYDSKPQPISFKSAVKRPRSPSTSSIFSPTKRRILREAGLLTVPDYRKSPSRESSAQNTLMGSMSPGRRLDFGPLLNDSSSAHGSHGSISSTAARQRTRPSDATKKLASSSELVSSRLTALPALSDELPPTLHSSSSSLIPSAPIMVPRELPPSPNRQSVHYPGFDVHRDTAIELPSFSARISADFGRELHTEDAKENIAPRKRVKKTVSAPADVEKTGRWEADATGAKASRKRDDELPGASLPVTPIHISPRHTPQTPRAHGTPRTSFSSSYVFTPGRTPRAGKDVLANKRVLEKEVDIVCSEDEADAVDGTL